MSTPVPHPVPDDKRSLAITMMATEHFTLETARGAATTESIGRATVFLGTLSSALVALGFVAQISAFGRPFSVFALLILPPIAFLGVVTFQRAVQAGMEDELYMQGMSRIRRLYVELIPELSPYFVLPLSEIVGGSVPIARPAGTWQTFLTVGAAIGVINSVVIGAIVGLAVHSAGTPLFWVSAGIGIAVTMIAILAHYRYQFRRWSLVDDRLRHNLPATDVGAPV